MQLSNLLANPLPLLLLLGLSLGPAPISAAKKPPAKDAILLSTVEALTLRAGQMTTHRRVSAIPQLRCASRREVCALHEVSSMRCTNQGGGYGGAEFDAQWSCVADLPPELRLAAADVVCEGYSGPDDPYVLRGSCGVVYTLALTERGEARFPELVGGGGGGGWWGTDGTRRDGSESVDWSAILFSVVFLAVCAWILVSACRNAAANNNTGDRRPRRPARRAPGFGGGGWGGGDDGWDDPPPPYPGTKPSYSSSSAAASQGWRPGFWSGLAGGAAAGYAAGNAGRATRNRNDYRGGGGGGSGGWGGFGGSSSSSRSGSASVSTSRHESTGFGSTSRR